MVISAMMADQPPPLEATPILNEVPLLPHIVNGDTTQQASEPAEYQKLLRLCVGVCGSILQTLRCLVPIGTCPL